MEKVVRDGKVAIIYSPSYGAGWYTWNKTYPDMLFDPTVVHYILEEKFDEIKVYATLKWPDAYIGISTVGDLRVKWVDQGVLFKINEYDGNESIELKDSDQWMVA
jgi:hypothetical protein